MSANNPNKPDGGAAFPRNWSNNDGEITGMTLRDWLAGQAMSGLLATPIDSDDWDSECIPFLASDSYKIADAMIAEKSK